MKRYVLTALAGALVIWTALSALTLVQPGERAVVRRFGRILEDKPGPGLFVGLPWGLDQVVRVPVGRVKRVLVGAASAEEEEQGETPPGQLLTGDHNLVNVQAEITYTVFEDQADKFVLQIDRADALVARVTESVLAEWIAGHAVDEVLLSGKTTLRSIMLAQVQTRLDGYALGIKIEEAGINQLSPPRQVKEAFDRLAQAKPNIDTRINKAYQDRATKEREANAQVYHLQRMAAAYGHEQRLAAHADAETFSKRLQQYRALVAKNPDYLNTLWQDEMTRLYAHMRETGRIDVLDQYLSSEGLNITQFPLLPKKAK